MELNPKRNPVGWFEIPVLDVERARRFYSDVLGYVLERQESDTHDRAIFPMQDAPGAPGALVKAQHYVPAQTGVLVYFTSPSGDCATELAKVEAAGGRLLQEKFSIGEHGFVGLFEDTEGNRLALHSRR